MERRARGGDKKATNMELARDLASLSVFGGVLIYGIRDKTLDVVGVDAEALDSMKTRISQVAERSIHPPLSSIIHPEIRNPDDLSRAVLVVEVPASPLAPHMVEDKGGNAATRGRSYWGRSADGKRTLSDDEVRLLMSHRASSEEKFEGHLRMLVAEDPIPAPAPVDAPMWREPSRAATHNGHIYLLAGPCAPVVARTPSWRLRKTVVNLLSGERDGAAGAPAHLDLDYLIPRVRQSRHIGAAERWTEIAKTLCVILSVATGMRA